MHALTSVVSSIYPTRLVGLRDRITLHEASLTDRGALELVAAAAKPQLVFHLGAYTHVGKSWQRVDECVQVNVQGTVNLLMALAPHGYRRLVNIGTSEIYGDIDVPFREDARPHPVSPYSVSKFAAEEYCRLFAESSGWPIVRLRPFNAYGPAQSPDRVIPEIITRGGFGLGDADRAGAGTGLRGQPLRMTQGKQTREFNYVGDLVTGMLQAAATPGIEGELFNLGCGVDVSMRDLATTILDLLGNPAVAEFGALPDRQTEIWEMGCDPAKARERLGYDPQTSLADGLTETIDWYREELTKSSTPFVAP